MDGSRGAMEKLLLERFDTVLKKEKKLAFHGELKKIRDTLYSKLNQLGDDDFKVVDGDDKVFKGNGRDLIREHLFRLNNMMIEARMIPTHLHYLTSDYYNVQADIKKLKVDVEKKISGSGPGSQEHSAPARIQNENDVSTPTLNTIPRATSAPARMRNVVEGPETKSELEWKVKKVKRWSMLSLPKEIHGFQSDELAMENLLLYHSSSNDAEETEEADFNAVGIVGAEGVGKTTLAWKVLNRPLVAKAFLPRILINDIDEISVSGNDDVIKKKIAIARRILSALGVDDGTIITSDEPRRPNNNNSANLELAALICAIRSELKGKRYLVVLDGVNSLDVWEVDKEEQQLAESLWFAFPRGSGGAVVVTGRDIKEKGKDNKENLVTEIVRRARGADRRVKKTPTPTPETVTTLTTETAPSPTPTTTPPTETAPTPASERDDYDEKRKIYRLTPLDNPSECWEIYKDEIGELLEEDVDKDLLELRDGMTGKDKDGKGAAKEGKDKEEPKSDRAKRMTVEDEVIRKCKGYPMAARMMAVIRKDQLEKKKRENPGTTTTTTSGGGATTTSGGEIQEHGENDS